MKPTQQLHNLGQSLWLDNITRALLTSGTLRSYIDDLSVTGLTSNPSIFDVAIKDSNLYDDAIRQKTKEGKSGEVLFFELAIDDLRQAADLFRPVHDSTGGVDGWVSLEVSPLLAYDAASTVKEAVQLHARAQRPNLFIKIPGTSEGRTAIEDAIFAGVPINVTLLFSSGHYIAAAEAYLRGIERRIAAGLGSGSTLRGIDICQPLGQSRNGEGPKGSSKPSGHCDREAYLQSVPGFPRFAALAESRCCRRSATAPALGEHWHKRPRRIRCTLHHGARCPGHHQYDSRGDVARVRQSRRTG